MSKKVDATTLLLALLELKERNVPEKLQESIVEDLVKRLPKASRESHPQNKPTDNLRGTTNKSLAKVVTKNESERVMSAIRQMVGPHNHLYLYKLGEALNMSPAQLLPIIHSLRMRGRITGSALEGRYGISDQQARYVTNDDVGIISLRE